jgi:eukaryotic-like serine/threonine-protein kinase
MTPSRWQQIEELYHAALECVPGERTAFLARADPELRREVESLLAQESGGTPIDHPAWEGAASPLGSTAAVLTPGTQLGPYKIEGPLGSGGMGEVFRATDTRLGRSVAIKTSQEQFSARFDREARAISSLNHPHICTLYDVGPNYLVMELCEGETLAARLKRGKLSIDDTLRYGQQIADALAAAHAKGIVHRDLKPGNIMLSKAGIKVLDFGLAKSPHDLTLTGTRMVMGTPAYMAPEQREGKECDARTDIYSLGLVLYEMVTGKRAEQVQIPSLDTLPPQLAHVIERCVEQDPDDRWQSARDLQRELQWAATSPPIREGASEPGATHRPWLAWSVAGLLAVATAVALWAPWRKPPAATETVQFQIQQPEKPIRTAFLQVSPDGRYIVFGGGAEGHDRLWLRSLDSLNARALTGTDDPTNPFWSSDSRFIAFRAEGKLKKIPIAGGPPQIICDLPGDSRGGDWNQDGVILFGNQYGGVSRTSATGGPQTEVTVLDKARQEIFHARPVFLPDGKHFLYVRASINQEAQGIYLGALDVQPELQSRQRLLPGAFGVS